MQRLIDWVRANGSGIEGIFKIAGNSPEISSLRAIIDNKQGLTVDLNGFDIMTIASCIKLLLKDNMYSLLPQQTQAALIDAYSIFINFFLVQIIRKS